MKTTPKKRVIIFLVHGTYARKALWTQKGSKLRSAVEASFAGEAQFREFLWSGRNSFSARNKAAIELGKELNQTATENPKIPIILIGHSHGGNVALKSLDYSQASESVAGVICLSTPFLLVRTRRYGASRLSGAMLFLPLMFTAIVLFMKRLYPGWAGHPITTVVGMLILFGGILLAISLVISTGESIQLKAQELAITARQILIARFWPNARSRLLIIRHAGDEATAGLGTATFASWLLSFCYGTVNAIWGKGDTTVGRALGRIPGWFWILVGLLLGALFYIDTTQKISPWGAALTILLGAYIFVKLILNSFKEGTLREAVLGSVLIFLSPVLGVFSLAFGPEMFVISLWSEVTVESTPPGDWELLLLEQKSDEGKPGLTHSAAYDDERAFEAVNRFLQRVTQKH